MPNVLSGFGEELSGTFDAAEDGLDCRQDRCGELDDLQN